MKVLIFGGTGKIGSAVPWHISRYFPAYQMRDVPPTPLNTMQMAKEIGLASGLNYVYLGNLNSDGDMDTKCPHCGNVLIERSYWGVVTNNIKENRCPNCGMEIAGVGL